MNNEPQIVRQLHHGCIVVKDMESSVAYKGAGVTLEIRASAKSFSFVDFFLKGIRPWPMIR